MNPFDVGYGGALVAGVLSFLSPCVLPLVPAYLCFVSGRSFEELTAGAMDSAVVWQVARSATAFVAGFVLVFVAMGATATVFSRLIAEHMRVLGLVAGSLIVVFGIHYMGLIQIRWLDAEARAHPRKVPSGLIGAFVLGLAFAFGWTPCVGPVLAAILMVAATGETAGQGALLLAAYGAGIGLPFLAAALAIRPFLGVMRKLRPYMRAVKLAMGGLLVVTGLLILTGSLSFVGQWLLDTFPRFGGVG